MGFLLKKLIRPDNDGENLYQKINKWQVGESENWVDAEKLIAIPPSKISEEKRNDIIKNIFEMHKNGCWFFKRN